MSYFADELFLAFVRSNRAHAKIVSVNSSEAFSVPGVVDFITHEDVQGSNLWGFSDQTREVFASEKVRYLKNNDVWLIAIIAFIIIKFSMTHLWF